jgi:1,6-anhydro-N-acetylmuramate kinase
VGAPRELCGKAPRRTPVAALGEKHRVLVPDALQLGVGGGGEQRERLLEEVKLSTRRGVQIAQVDAAALSVAQEEPVAHAVG